jgi:hypothetical protein
MTAPDDEPFRAGVDNVWKAAPGGLLVVMSILILAELDAPTALSVAFLTGSIVVLGVLTFRGRRSR